MEIERKWLLNRLPLEKERCENHYLIWQSYLVAEDGYEVRVRRAETLPGHKGSAISPYKFTFKTGGDLARIETECELDYGEYIEYIEAIHQVPIKKEYFSFIVDGYSVEISVVDNSWIYAEVEFPSESIAHEYEFPWPELVISEITYNKDYKMKNYWNETRMNK